VLGRQTFSKSILPPAILALLKHWPIVNTKIMVKLKEGYVMNPREQAEFDRVNALPRKTSGRVDFYYKPQTKYPPRIYLFMHAETWCDRNRRPMGLFHAVPFLSRPMNQEEIEYHHFDIRLCYHQYEDWDKLIYSEEQEAEFLDRETPGVGKAFLRELKTFRERCPIGSPAVKLKSVTQLSIESEETLLMRELIKNGGNYSAKEISMMMMQEQDGDNRLVIKILLREMYKMAAGGKGRSQGITAESVEKKVLQSQERTRKNFVRRVFKQNKLFAMEEIKVRYPDYEEWQLLLDLHRKPGKPKKHKHKPVLDLRRCQLEKLSEKLKIVKNDEKEYHAVCQRIAILAEAHRNRLPIPITVKLQDEVLVYYFHWKIRETVVKSFVMLANTKGMTHQELGRKHQEMVSSNYNY
jgi:hypothetical protein